MFNFFIMPTACLLALATFGGSLSNRDQLVDFLWEWYSMHKYADEVLNCLQKNRPALPNDAPVSGFQLPLKADRKAILAESRAWKKMKHPDDPVAAEKEKMMKERDDWANGEGCASDAAKAQIIKRKKDEMKLLKQQGLLAMKPHGKAKGKTQALERLALNNSCSQAQYGTFKAILSDLIVETETLDQFHGLLSVNETPLASQTFYVLQTARTARLGSNERKKAATHQLAASRQQKNSKRPRTTTSRPSTPPPAAMELNRSGSKRKVRVTAKGVENTPSKRMRLADD